jgi:hypothetical protein
MRAGTYLAPRQDGRYSIEARIRPSVGIFAFGRPAKVECDPNAHCVRRYFVVQSRSMEFERALADLEEVRDRLAACQQFKGYSAPAAAASGAIAVAAGIVQLVLIPHPSTEADARTYLIVWFGCLVIALALNYGALGIWYAQNAGRQERVRTRSAGITLLPAIVLGAVLSLSLILHGLIWMLPGVWYASYAVGLFASRALVPKGAIPLAAAFGIAGAVLLLSPDPTLGLSWWVMPLGFGLGQIFIGWLLLRETDMEALR